MAIDQDITNLPTPPSRSDSPSDFSDKADTFLAALPQLQTELNLYADEANTTQTAINTSETNAATSETNAESWASKIDGIVLSTDFSAKAYALGGTGVTDVVGAAKEWAIKTGSTVDGADFSAKKYAQDSSNFADAAAATVNATEWQSGTTYDEFDAVIGSDGNTYRSLTNSNLGNDPVSGDGSNWLQLTSTTPDLVLKPEPVEPADGATDIGETPTLDGGNYYSLYGKTHAISRFQVASDVGLSTIVYDSGEISGTTTHTVPAGNLSVSTSYYWRVYYEDEDAVESEWSDVFSFTTSDNFFQYITSNIGQQTDGGFYAGNVVSDVDSQTYAIIVSDGDGDTDRTGAGLLSFGTSNTTLPEAQTLADGKSVMDHIVNNETLSDFPAFEWVQTTLNNANYNGYSDWYLPTRDELELIYRHFKPTTADNDTGTRATSGFGADGETYGTNNSSDPNGSGYTTTDPSQTSVTSFQDGGADYLSAIPYGTSTELSVTGFWFQRINSGQQSEGNKTDGLNGWRAVRRVQV